MEMRVLMFSILMGFHVVDWGLDPELQLSTRIQHPDSTRMAPPSKQEVLKMALLNVDLGALVNQPLETAVVDGFFKEHPCKGRDLARAATKWRFEARGRLAALILLYRSNDSAYESIPASHKARTYCEAFASDVMEDDEPWGALWWSDDIGPLGFHIVQQGESAIPFLKPMLNENRLHDRYSGGERAAELSIRGYRTKDFAAFYIAKIRKYELPWQGDTGKRDAAIQEMEKALEL